MNFLLRAIGEVRARHRRQRERQGSGHTHACVPLLKHEATEPCARGSVNTQSNAGESDKSKDTHIETCVGTQPHTLEDTRNVKSVFSRSRVRVLPRSSVAPFAHSTREGARVAEGTQNTTRSARTTQAGWCSFLPSGLGLPRTGGGAARAVSFAH